MIDALTCKKGILIDAELDFGVDVVAGLDTNLCVVTTTSLKFILALSSLEETLLFGRGARSCWPTAACDCRDLQT